MHFEKENLYHIYNQGNNRQEIFFSRENYLFFLRKIKTHILPFADILAWCLMPNHFHLMVYVNEVEAEISGSATLSHTPTNPDMTLSRTPNNIGNTTLNRSFSNIDNGGATQSRTPIICSIQKSIGILLASYTRAINKQNGTTGSLFRSKTKAECLNQLNGISPTYYNTCKGTMIHVDRTEFQYPKVCFDYIHQNPVKANLVKNETGWEFSSARDYAGMRQDGFVNMERAKNWIS